MRDLVVVALLLGLVTGCAAGPTSSPAGGPRPASVVYVRDLRPIDVELQELKIARDAQGTYTASLRTSYSHRLKGREVSETKELARGLECSFTSRGVHGLRDSRPADGDLKELTVA